MSESAFAELDEVLRENRRSGDVAPRDKRRKVFVDARGRIVVGDRLPKGDEGNSLSEIHQAVFA
jgi:hypothetical protein